MFDNINPQLPYYLLLYLFTILVRAIRNYRSRPGSDAPISELKKYKYSYTHVAFELVNVSAGVFILISQTSAKYVGSYMIMFALLVFISAFLEEDKVEYNIKAIGHIAISILVITVTLFAFLKINGLKGISANDEKWKVSLPYVDNTLNTFCGIKETALLSSYTVDVKANSREEAIQAAKTEFQGPKGPVPFSSKTKKSQWSLVILESQAIAEKTSK